MSGHIDNWLKRSRGPNLQDRAAGRFIDNVIGMTPEAAKYRAAQTHSEAIVAKRDMLDRADTIDPSLRARSCCAKVSKQVNRKKIIIDGEPEPVRPVAIYALSSTEDDVIRYVGQTGRLRERIHMHIRDAEANASRKDQWVFEVAKAGHLRVTVLEWVHPDHWEQAERRWIACGLDDGWPLLNITEGGSGLRRLDKRKVVR